MHPDQLLHTFAQFGLAGLIGFLIGLEREMRDPEKPTIGIRDFVLIALTGATSAFLASLYDSPWMLLPGFLGVLAFLLSSYWAQRAQEAGFGITTEIAALLTFLMAALILQDAAELAAALGIVIVAVLFPKQAIKRFRARVQTHEMQATVTFLVITFIVLPILPRQSLDNFLTIGVGKLTAVERESGQLEIALDRDYVPSPGEQLRVYGPHLQPLGSVEVRSVDRVDHQATGVLLGPVTDEVVAGVEVRSPFGVPFLNTMLSALKPYNIWLIVVLVSFISFVGYVLIKVVGSRVGVGLTGLIGGLVSSTVTTLSFAKRSRELPSGNRQFAVAVVLASSIMFPRLILQITVVNRELAHGILLPLVTMTVVGLILAAFYFRHSQRQSAEQPQVHFTNPFSLKSAVSFALVFATILMATKLAVTYLGNAWLPVVALVSGLTDADAIAFSISALQKGGQISVDWASFNLVLGALANTFVKLFLVFALGDRGLFRYLLVAFLVMGAAGIATLFLFYDLASGLA